MLKAQRIWEYLRSGPASFISCLLALLGAPSWWLCEEHWCNAGHMHHPPYPWWHYLSDGLWTLCWFLAAVIAILSPQRRYWLITLLIILSQYFRGGAIGGQVVPFTMLLVFAGYGVVRGLRG